MKRNTWKFVALILMCIGIILVSTSAQNGTSKSVAVVDSKAKPEVSGIVKLSPEIVQAIDKLNKDWVDAQKDLQMVNSRIANIRTEYSLQFTRFCAKNKLDPDEYELTQDQTGVQKKSPKPEEPKEKPKL